MHFSEYQIKAAQTAIYPGQGTQRGLEYVLYGLAGEVGELLNKYKKVLRDSNGNLTQDVTESMLKEIGDQEWYSAMICTELKASLEKVVDDNLAKLLSRKERGTLHGSGDNR